MSLKTQAMLVSLNITKPQLTKKDRKATVDAELANNAHGAGKYIKLLYPKYLLDPITQVENEARAYLYARTLPWNKGTQLLPSKRYMEFAPKMHSYEIAFDQAVIAFLNNYNNVMLEAERVQGGLFDLAEYPDMSELRHRFSMKCRYFPIADTRDWRLELEQDTMREARDAADESIRTALAESMKEPFKRLYDAVERIHTQCAKPEGRIYDSLMDNLDELLDILPDLNLTGDAMLTGFIETCRERVSVHPETLRAEPDIRANVASQAADIIAKMKAFV